MASRGLSSGDVQGITSLLRYLADQARLCWGLLWHPRVPFWTKLVPAFGLLYLLSPIDLIPGWLVPGLGQLDDVAVILLSFRLFIELAPPGVVAGVRRRSAAVINDGEVIDATYRVIDD